MHIPSFQVFTRRAPLLGLAALGLLAAFPQAASAQDIITFDSFVSQPPRNGATPISNANGGSSTYDGVTFSGNAFVLGDQLSGSSGPLVTPHSGNYAYADANAQTTTLLTTKTLYGLYLGQINTPNTAASVTVNALGSYNAATGTYAILGSTAADALTSTKLSFFDTSSLAIYAKLPTFSGYSLVSQGAVGTTNSFDYAGDDFTFSPVSTAPVSTTINADFNFDTDSVGTGSNPSEVHTRFSDISNGVTATFSSPYDGDPYHPTGGSFGIFPGNPSNFPDFSGNALVELNVRYTPLFVAFNHTLTQGSVAFNDNSSNGTGVFTVQELLNGVAVGGPITSSTFGTVSFSGTAFNSLIFSDTNSQFAIDNLDVVAAVPEASTTISLGLLLMLGLGGLALTARKKAAV